MEIYYRVNLAPTLAHPFLDHHKKQYDKKCELFESNLSMLIKVQTRELS